MWGQKEAAIQDVRLLLWVAALAPALQSKGAAPYEVSCLRHRSRPRLQECATWSSMHVGWSPTVTALQGQAAPAPLRAAAQPCPLLGCCCPAQTSGQPMHGLDHDVVEVVTVDCAAVFSPLGLQGKGYASAGLKEAAGCGSQQGMG